MGSWLKRKQKMRMAAATVNAVARPQPLTVLWRWRYEIAVAAGIPAAGVLLAGRFGTVPVVAVACLVALVVLAWPAARRFVWARIRCVITAHRIRVGCAEALILSGRGRLPAILFVGAEPFGERVWFWHRPGMTVSDFEEAREVLAGACWAVDVQVVRHRGRMPLLILDVIRYPGLWDGYRLDAGPYTVPMPGTMSTDRPGTDPGLGPPQGAEPAPGHDPRPGPERDPMPVLTEAR